MPFDNNIQLFSHSAALLLMLLATVKLNGMYQVKRKKGLMRKKRIFLLPPSLLYFSTLIFPFSISSIHRNHIVVPVCAISEPNEHRREEKKGKKNFNVKWCTKSARNGNLYFFASRSFSASI